MARTKLYGLIGKDISYSFSANYFTEKFKTKNITESLYVNFDIDTLSKLSEILEQNPNLQGLNVTIPYKESIIPYLDTLSKKARKIGAVNTIKITSKGKLKGYNTDHYGFEKALKPMLKPMHKKALILGKGGASKAVEFALTNLGISSTYVSRTAQEQIYTYEQLTQEIMQEHLIVINTTPLGTFPNIEQAPDIPYQHLGPNHIAFDLTYNPEQTQFLIQAYGQGAQIQNGYLMLKYQAEKAWKIWNKNSFLSNLTTD